MTVNPQKIMNAVGDMLTGKNPQAAENFRMVVENNKALATELLGGAICWAMKKDEMFRHFVEGVLEDSIETKECACGGCINFDKKIAKGNIFGNEGSGLND